MPIPRPEYPRPHFDRSSRWVSLNGTWDFRRGDGTDADRDERITVPFAWETPASGVGAHWLDRAVYRRRFGVDAGWAGERVILHFGAVHHEAVVRVDGREVGRHVGGYLPFEFDITDALADTPEHELEVHVHAPLDKRSVAHGKQRSIPADDYDSCAFTPSSGIWQPVWLEPRPATHLAALDLAPADTLDAIRVAGAIHGAAAVDATATIRVAGAEPREVTADELAAGVAIPIAEARLWSPADPHLYEVVVEVRSADGLDRVASSTGLRRIETRGAEIHLNGQRISLRGVLDQGYWPETGITAPDDDAFVRDLELARDAGFTLVRKHLKLEDPRFLHHADRMGMLVWAEPASTGRYSPEAAEAFAAQIEPMVRRDGGHPSIVVWGLYNEEWGLDWDLPGDSAKQETVRDAVRQLKSLDASRPVVDNSGWTHVDSDLIDWHVYDEQPGGWARKVAALVTDDAPTFPVAIAVDRTVDKALMVDGPVPADVPFLNSEFGGGYTGIDRGWNLHWQTQELRRHDRIAGYVWTELNDIEQETAGIVDADRAWKDHGGRPPAHANGETVTVFDVTPVAPGRDVVAPDGSVAIPVAVSHHGTAPIDVVVRAAWGPVFGVEPATGAEEAGAVRVEPFRLSDAVTVSARLPEGSDAARLHVLLETAEGIVGRGCVDVVRA